MSADPRTEEFKLDGPDEAATAGGAEPLVLTTPAPVPPPAAPAPPRAVKRRAPPRPPPRREKTAPAPDEGAQARVGEAARGEARAPAAPAAPLGRYWRVMERKCVSIVGQLTWVNAGDVIDGAGYGAQIVERLREQVPMEPCGGPQG